MTSPDVAVNDLISALCMCGEVLILVCTAWAAVAVAKSILRLFITRFDTY